MTQSKEQKEADKLLRELTRDLNQLLPEGSLCSELLYQNVVGDTWVGRYYGYYMAKVGYYQFSLDLKKQEITIAEEVIEK